MRRIGLLHIIGTLLMTSLLVACSHGNELQMAEVGASLSLQRPWEVNYDFDCGSYTVQLPIICNADWTVSCDESWVELSKNNGFGMDTVKARIAVNKTSSLRTADVVVALARKPQTHFSYSISQKGFNSLICVPGYEKGAGYAYDVKAQYCEGATWQIFDVASLDYLQYLSDANGRTLQYGLFVTDNAECYAEEQFVAGKTMEEISNSMSASATLDIDVPIVTVDVTGNVRLSDITTKETVCGIKRTKRIVFVRDIQYLNCVAAAKAGWVEVFSPAFREDWQVLENQCDETPNLPQCNAFLDKWGLAFISRSCLGGSLDYEMEIEKDVLTESLTIEAAIDAEVAGGVLNAEGNVEWKDIHERIKNSFSADLHVYGGNVQLVSIIADRSGSLSPTEFSNWQNSIRFGTEVNDPDQNNVVLVDVKVVSIANLFTGNTRKILQTLINERIKQ